MINSFTTTINGEDVTVSYKCDYDSYDINIVIEIISVVPLNNNIVDILSDAQFEELMYKADMDYTEKLNNNDNK